MLSIPFLVPKMAPGLYERAFINIRGIKIGHFNLFNVRPQKIKNKKKYWLYACIPNHGSWITNARISKEVSKSSFTTLRAISASSITELWLKMDCKMQSNHLFQKYHWYLIIFLFLLLIREGSWWFLLSYLKSCESSWRRFRELPLCALPFKRSYDLNVSLEI